MTSTESFGDIPVDDSDEPSMLGASDTIEAPKGKRKRQKVRRQRPPKDATGADGHIEYIYEPHVAVVPPLRTYFASLWERRAFLVALARSDIRGSRSSTTLGSLWALLDPLFMAAIYFFLFTIIRSGGGRSADFIPLIINGILLFQVVGGAITQGGNSVRSGKNLMLNSTFPRALLPLSTIYKLIIGAIPAIPIILLAKLIFADWNLTEAYSAQLLWFFPLFIIMIVLAVGFALIISTLVVFFNDVSNLMQYVSRILFFSTPIVYPWGLIGDTSVFNYVRWQPLFGVYVNYQNIITDIRPDFAMMATSAVWAVVLLVFGFWLFLRNERKFASRI